MPRGVTATFTASLRRLTHPGTSVGLRGSPLIHSIPSSGDLRNPATRFAPTIILSEESRWSSTDGHPISGTVFHPLPPAWGFVHTVLPVGQYSAGRFVQEPNGFGKSSISASPEWKPDLPKISLCEILTSPSIIIFIVKSGHLSSGCANHPENL